MNQIQTRFDCRYVNEGKVRLCGSPSTLLIAKRRLAAFEEVRHRCGGRLSIVLRVLLERHRFLLRQGLLPSANRSTVQYQESGEEYVRFNFRPYDRDWLELSQLALAHGLSRCLFFDYLMTLDLSGYSEMHKIPAHSQATERDLRFPGRLRGSLEYDPRALSLFRIFESVPQPESEMDWLDIYALTRTPEAKRYPWPYARYL